MIYKQYVVCLFFMLNDVSSRAYCVPSFTMAIYSLRFIAKQIRILTL